MVMHSHRFLRLLLVVSIVSAIPHTLCFCSQKASEEESCQEHCCCTARIEKPTRCQCGSAHCECQSGLGPCHCGDKPSDRAPKSTSPDSSQNHLQGIPIIPAKDFWTAPFSPDQILALLFPSSQLMFFGNLNSSDSILRC